MHTVSAQFPGWTAADTAIAALRDHGFSLDQVTLTEASPWGPDAHPELYEMVNSIPTGGDGLPWDSMMDGISNRRSLDNQYGTVHEVPPVVADAGELPVIMGRSPIVAVVRTDAAHAEIAAEILREAGGSKVRSSL